MKTEVQKWGNSLAIRIPRAFAEETHLDRGTEVDLTLKAGRLVISRRARKRYELASLLARVRPTNRPPEEAWGGPAGREVW